MLDGKELRRQVKDHMGPVFEANGFKYKYEGKGSTWMKPIEDGEYFIGIGLFMDTRVKDAPEFRMTLFLDSIDISDIRAYRHSGWPPKEIMNRLGIKVSLAAKILSGGYDAWIPFPKVDNPDPKVWEDYASYLLENLYKRIPKGKKWVKKTHRWEYKLKD